VTPLKALARPLFGLYDRPYILLVFTTLFWGGNVVAGRLAVGEVSPMAVVFLRWVISFALMAIFAWKPIKAEYRAALPHWPMFFVLGIFGYTGFNALYYAAAHITSGVNIAIIQGSTPIAVLLVGFLVFRNRLTALQLAGALVTIVGVLLAASKGDWQVIANFAFNRGDLYLLIASMLYAVYTLMLMRNRPQVSMIVFFAAMSAAACLSSIPLLAYEAYAGQLMWPTFKGWMLILYIGVLPSLLCQLAYIRGVELIGPGRAIIFYNLIPIFGALLSALVLREAVTIYDALALGLVIAGIYIAEKSKPAP
jgi:drug/metabolite transporter (DMT)-like permease